MINNNRTDHDNKEEKKMAAFRFPNKRLLHLSRISITFYGAQLVVGGEPIEHNGVSSPTFETNKWIIVWLIVN